MEYRQARYNFFKWRYESNFAHKLALAFIFAGLTGLGAQLRIYLPFTPVPITAQVFFVLLSGVVLGKWYGGASQLIYIGLGGAGLPWFAGMNSGWAYLTGVTGGYIIGFVVAATIIGWFVDNFVRARNFTFQLSLMLFGVVIIYALGALQFYLVLASLGFKEVVAMAVLPFIPGDILKALAAVGAATMLLPKEAYNGEVDFKDAVKARLVNTAGAVVSGILTVFFVLLFWLKLLSLGEISAAELLKQSFWYSSSALLSGLLLLHFSKKLF
jgi:biotin transport system substrate-specific component